MKYSLLILAILLAPLAGANAQVTSATRPATTAPAASKELSAITSFMKPVEADPSDDALRQKLKERHNTAVRLLELRVDAYRHGLTDVSSVFDAARTAADAKLELAQNVQERQAVIEHALEVTREVESHLEKQFQAGVGSESALMRARLARETAEIELLKLKQGRAAPTTQPQ
jgi:hypothetical protein